MVSWRKMLRGDSLSWLLEPDEAQPGVRYFAMRDIMEYPQDGADVDAAQDLVMESGPVPAILDAQYPEGFWVKPGGGYSPKYRSTVWQVIFLAELGAQPTDERVRRGCEYVLEHSIAPNGAFSVRQKPVNSGSIHCLNGNLLYALQQLGYGEDPRVRKALDWQARSITGESSFRYLRSGATGPCFACSANEAKPCGWGACKAMKALLAVAPGRRTSAMTDALRVGVEFLLSRDPAQADYPYTARVSSTWFKLGFPLTYWSDVLEILHVLTLAGYGDDPRLKPALQFVLDKQDEQGRWPLENALTGKMWAEVGVKRQPSKWITLRVLRVLKAMDLEA